jgi:hypothetical protein
MAIYTGSIYFSGSVGQTTSGSFFASMRHADVFFTGQIPPNFDNGLLMGSIDDVRISNGERNATEIMASYLRGKGYPFIRY